MENDFSIDDRNHNDDYDTGIYTCPFCKGHGVIAEEFYPLSTDAYELLGFLAERMEHAAVGEGVARSYARDIRKVLERHEASKPKPQG